MNLLWLRDSTSCSLLVGAQCCSSQKLRIFCCPLSQTSTQNVKKDHSEPQFVLCNAEITVIIITAILHVLMSKFCSMLLYNFRRFATHERVDIRIGLWWMRMNGRLETQCKNLNCVWSRRMLSFTAIQKENLANIEPLWVDLMYINVGTKMREETHAKILSKDTCMNRMETYLSLFPFLFIIFSCLLQNGCCQKIEKRRFTDGLYNTNKNQILQNQRFATYEFLYHLKTFQRTRRTLDSKMYWGAAPNSGPRWQKKTSKSGFFVYQSKNSSFSFVFVFLIHRHEKMGEESRILQTWQTFLEIIWNPPK